MGKSNFINQALTQIVENYSPQYVQFYLIDLKLGVELDRWRTSEHTTQYCWEIDSKDKDDPKNEKTCAVVKRVLKRKSKKE